MTEKTHYCEVGNTYTVCGRLTFYIKTLSYCDLRAVTCKDCKRIIKRIRDKWMGRRI